MCFRIKSAQLCAFDNIKESVAEKNFRKTAKKFKTQSLVLYAVLPAPMF